jgi:hypothetical protein
MAGVHVTWDVQTVEVVIRKNHGYCQEGGNRASQAQVLKAPRAHTAELKEMC